VSREALELEEALRGQRVRRQELGELVHLTGAEGDVDEREAREDLVLDRLRPAAADADDPLGVLALEALGVAEVREELAVGLLADRAGVEEDDVGVRGGGRLGVAERLEHALHPLGVVLVHLAAERRDVVALHASLKGSPARAHADAAGLVGVTLGAAPPERAAALPSAYLANSTARDSRITVTLI
jgi:hypothetical protein